MVLEMVYVPSLRWYHMLFSCVTTQILGSCFREVVGQYWCDPNFPNLYAELCASSAATRRIMWFGIGTITWTLCMICNKLLIEHSPYRARLMQFSNYVVFCICESLLVACRSVLPWTGLPIDSRLWRLDFATPSPPPPDPN